MCFVFIWEQTATCATYSINWLVFITQVKSLVYVLLGISLASDWVLPTFWNPLSGPSSKDRCGVWSVNGPPQGRYSSTLSLTLAQDGGGWSTMRPGCFTPGKETQYPMYRRMGGPQGQAGQVQKILPPLGFDPQTVQPVASRYTDWAIPAHLHYNV
jgi:hypothetical protein